MDAGEFSWAILVTWLGLGFMGLFALGLLYASATNIERRALVGGVTLLSVALAMAYFYMARMQWGITSWWQIIATLAVPIVAHLLVRLLDRALGAKLHSKEANKATYGAELSD